VEVEGIKYSNFIFHSINVFTGSDNHGALLAQQIVGDALWVLTHFRRGYLAPLDASEELITAGGDKALSVRQCN
jgi:hypothetical protein